MIKLFTEEEYLKAKCKDLLPLQCEECGETFYRKKEYVTHAINHPKMHELRFCGCSCSITNSNKNRKLTEEHKSKISRSITRFYDNNNINTRTCIVCGTKYRYHKGLGINTRKCCCKDCSDYYWAHKVDFLPEETRLKFSENARQIVAQQENAKRSKNEILFCNMCIEYFGEDKVKHNECLFNGWDADIVLNDGDLRLAILWNGPWHYKEISKKISLKQIQSRDKIKVEEITKCGYNPYIIKDMGSYNEDFVKKQFSLLLEYVKTK